MNRATHNLLGAASGFGLGLALGWPWWQVAGSAVLASVTSDGPTSPDGDQFKAWKTFDRWVPDELLGKGGPFQHRGISHWWGLPALAAVAVYLLAPAWLAWALWALVVGWASHLVGDFVFGRQCWGQDGHGIPLAPWWAHVGVGLKSGGVVERFAAAPALAGLLAWEGWHVVALVGR